MNYLVTLLILLGLHSQAAVADETMAMMHHGSMMMDEKGMIMNANSDNLPKDCPKLSGDVNITIHAGRKHALKFPGKMFAFDNQQWEVKPCSRINITFINDDQIRHQLMIHGLPGYLYPQGMFHLELYGQGELKASLIVPSQKKTYLVHCELAQHMEKGMKAQLKVGKGDGDLPSIPGVTAYVVADDYKGSLPAVMAAVAAAAEAVPAVVAKKPAPVEQPPKEDSFISGVTVIGLAIGLVLAPFLAKKFKGMSASEVVATLFDMLRTGIDQLVKLLSKLVKLVASNKNKILPGS